MVADTITALYWEELHRAPDWGGLTNWIGQARENGFTVVEIRAGIQRSTEWQALHGM